MAVKKAKVEVEENDAIKDALASLRKKYGDDVVKLESEEPVVIEAIPTGCFAIDRLLGCGGLPRGRIIEMYGEPSSGKSATSLYFMSEIQKQGGTCVLVDAEFAFNSEFAGKIGVDTKKLFVAQPATLEEAMDTVRAFIASNSIDLIVVDSVAALVPKREVDGDEMLKDAVADQARLMNKALRILTGEVARSKTVVIFINHLKEKIGIVWGSKETTPGGKALKFYASVRLSVSKGDKITGAKEVQIGNMVKISATKNKVGFPYRKGAYDLYYETGVDKHSDTFDTAEEFGIITKAGITFSFGEVKLGAGRDKAIDALKKDEKIYEEIRKKVTKAVKEEK